ncbi:hypothetical protein Pyrfu_1248 [Pyrolobus fumarii 1A]|uniref:Uncharacterized protein n=1 Tax=Pyrolobus fumarii (strain DSM 11204 / 1A) TaxID=694429 RepID=G0EG06_PYRF1|nr:hypothetical protein [Pyrolobus fumarii]AEM39107.1 hypothetical protein Pyrfu_1248 [Pyrolobus fumarii 1A]
MRTIAEGKASIELSSIEVSLISLFELQAKTAKLDIPVERVIQSLEYNAWRVWAPRVNDSNIVYDTIHAYALATKALETSLSPAEQIALFLNALDNVHVVQVPPHRPYTRYAKLHTNTLLILTLLLRDARRNLILLHELFMEARRTIPPLLPSLHRA